MDVSAGVFLTVQAEDATSRDADRGPFSTIINGYWPDRPHSQVGLSARAADTFYSAMRSPSVLTSGSAELSPRISTANERSIDHARRGQVQFDQSVSSGTGLVGRPPVDQKRSFSWQFAIHQNTTLDIEFLASQVGGDNRDFDQFQIEVNAYEQLPPLTQPYDGLRRYFDWSERIVVSNSTVDGNHSVTIPLPEEGRRPNHGTLTIVSDRPVGNSAGPRSGNAKFDFNYKTTELVAGLKHQTPACVEALKGSVFAQSFKSGTGGWFRPKANKGLTMNQVEDLCGVDHFNWLQHVVDIPDSWTAEIWEDVKWKGSQALVEKRRDGGRVHTGSGTPVVWKETQPPILDPQTRDRTVVFFVEGWEQFSVTAGNDYFDDEILFWNEDDRFKRLNVREQTTDQKLWFEDSPIFRTGMLKANEFVQFETKLAGVTADGGVVTWDGLGTNFKWKSNASSPTSGGTTEVVYTAPFPDGEVLFAVEGGTFDIQFDTITVPEPRMHFGIWLFLTLTAFRSQRIA